MYRQIYIIKIKEIRDKGWWELGSIKSTPSNPIADKVLPVFVVGLVGSRNKTPTPNSASSPFSFSISLFLIQPDRLVR